MDHRDHVRLLREGVLGGGRIWADLGSGEGAFTLALADLLGPTGSIYTVDRDGRALQVQVRALRDASPSVSITPLVADFTLPLERPPLDGIVMANSLHFERDTLAVLRLVRGCLRTAGRLILVEYDTDHGNPWVPFPLSFRSWAAVRRRPASARRSGSRRSRAGSSGRSTRRSASADRFNRPGCGRLFRPRVYGVTPRSWPVRTRAGVGAHDPPDVASWVIHGGRPITCRMLRGDPVSAPAPTRSMPWPVSPEAT